MSRLTKINIAAFALLVAFVLACQGGTPSGRTDPATGKGLNVSCGTDFVDFHGDEMYLGAAPRFYNKNRQMAVAVLARSECDKTPYHHNVLIMIQWCHHGGSCAYQPGPTEGKPAGRDWVSITSTPISQCTAIPMAKPTKQPAICRWQFYGCKIGYWRAYAQVNGDMLDKNGDVREWKTFYTLSGRLQVKSCVPKL